MIIRLILSLGFIAVVLLFAARLAKKRGLGQGNGLIEVVARQRMGRTSTVNVVRIADVVLVVGATEEQVTLLAEVDSEAVDSALARAPRAGRRRRRRGRRRRRDAAPPARPLLQRRAGRLGLRPRRLGHVRAPAARADGPQVMTASARRLVRARRHRRRAGVRPWCCCSPLLCTVAALLLAGPASAAPDRPGRAHGAGRPGASRVTAASTSPSATARRAPRSP